MANAPRKRGRPENLSDPVKITLGIPKDQHRYLELLAKRGKLGVSVSEVATHILVRELTAMDLSGFHDREVSTE